MTGAPQARRAVLVLGMHRSGTSALTRVLNLLGGDLSSRLVPALPEDNATGFWEPEDLVRINEEIFASRTSDWDDMSAVPASWFSSPDAESFRHEALQILRRDFSESSLFLLKDPRMCRLLPFWLSVFEEFDTEPLCAFILRNPLAVAASLKKRSGFSTARSCALWLRYLVDAEQATRHLTRCFTSYDRLLEDWQATANGIAEGLGIDWPRPFSKAAGQIEEFLSEGHRHHHFTTSDLEEHHDLSPSILEVHTASLSAAETGEETALRLASDTALNHLTSAECLFGPILTEGQTRGFTQALEKRDQQFRLLAQSFLKRNADWAHQASRLEHMKDRGFLHPKGIASPPPPHPFFDSAFYLKQNPEVAERGHDPWLHFLEIGRPHGCSPHPLFDIKFYGQQVPEVLEQSLDPLEHFVQVGAAQGKNPHPLFDVEFYLRNHPEAIQNGQDPLTHFLEVGGTQGANPHPLFDTSFYLDHDQNIAKAGINALIHYLEYGAVSMHDPHPLFDTPYFLLGQVEKIDEVTIPLLYFLSAEGASAVPPHPLFDTDFYLRQKPNEPAPKNALLHFLAQGARPDRNPHPFFDVEFYLEQAPELVERGMNPLVHYLREGATAGLDPHPGFDTRYYLSKYADVRRSSENPLLHYVRCGSRERRWPSPQASF